MDWPLAGAVGGTVILAGATAAWLVFLYQNSSDDVVLRAPTLASASSTRVSLDSTRPRAPVAYPSTQAPQAPLAPARAERVDTGILQSNNQYLPSDAMTAQPSSPDYTARPPSSYDYASRQPSSSDYAARPSSSYDYADTRPSSPQYAPRPPSSYDSMARRPASSDYASTQPSSDYASRPPLPPDYTARRPSSSNYASRPPSSADYLAKPSASPDHTKPTSPLSVAPPLPAHPQPSPQEWRAVATAGATSFNLGGHLDRMGVVDSLASSYLRDAFKKCAGYNKLPPEAKGWVEAPNVNLSKLAPYRALLGIDDAKIEAEQAVKFVRVASTRGIGDADIDDTDLNEETDVAVLAAGQDGPVDLLVLPPIR
jgi:hypothetical protein